MGQIQLHTSVRASAEIARLLGLRANCTLRKKTSAHYKVMPWASGSGSTTELYVSPTGSRLTDDSALWRISMARVPESGPFSLLQAYNRIITLVQGEGFRLTGNKSTNVEIRPGVIYPFSGAEAVDCELLGGPCLDLNLMYQGDKIKGSLTLLEQASPIHASITTQSSKEIIIVICLGGRVTVKAFGKRTNTLVPHDSIYFSSNEGQGRLILNAQAESKVALVSIENIK